MSCRAKVTAGSGETYTFTAQRYTFTYTGKQGCRVRERERGRTGGEGHTFLVKMMRKTGGAGGPVRAPRRSAQNTHADIPPFRR